MNEPVYSDYAEHVETHRKLNRELLDKLITKDYNGAVVVTEQMLTSICLIRAACLDKINKS
jgi:Zn-dependent oligopeptidase